MANMIECMNMSKTANNKEKIDELFTRGVGEFVDPNDTFRNKLELSPEKIVIKFGVDPTRPDLHLGHAVVLRKLRQLQDIGCKVIFLIGDITAQIGDPTGKSKIRPELNLDEINKNMNSYKEQVGKILNTEPAVFDWITNSDWFVSINDIYVENENSTKYNGEIISSFEDKRKVYEATRMQLKINPNNMRYYTLLNVLGVLRKISYSRLIERDMFQDRIKSGEPVFMHEMLYPVLQGIDSNVLYDIYGACDLEVGGTDQHFNMLVGRDVMAMNNRVPQSVLSFKILEGLDGKSKMSKSLDNYVGITDEPNDMYGKIMSIPDSSIVNYFELCTFTPMNEVENIRKELEKESVNPKDLKMNLAKQIVAIYHGEDKANQAEESFINTFQKKEIPEDVEEIEGSGVLGEILVSKNIVSSKSDWRRLVEDGAVKKLEGDSEEKITDFRVDAVKGVYKIGKKKFIKII